MTARRWILVAGAALVAVALAYATTLRREPTIGRDGSEKIGQGQPVVINRVPASYTLRYRLEEVISDGIRVNTETVTVRRPADAKVETRAGPPPGGRVVSTIVWTLGRTASTQGDAAPLISDQPPEVAGADVRLEATLGSAVHDGRIERRERRRVAGRVCQTLRTRHRLVAVAMERPTEEDFVDSCIDRDGLLLEEIQVVDNERQVRRVAVDVKTNQRVDASLFAVGKPTIDVMHAGGSTRPLDSASTPPGQFWQLDQPPPGFTLLGRFSVVPPQPENFNDDPTREAFRRAEVSDVFVNGVDIVVVARGATLRSQNPWEPDPDNATIDLGAVGRGEVVVTGHGNEVRALTGVGRYVRVYGTRPVDELAALARQLHEVPGGELKFLDE